jgi:drug/metabolite transporter (DMT)-like permease
MDKAILLAVAASICTATASVCQRKGARSNQTTGFDVRLVVRLARQPARLLGITSMILGFVFQLTALRFGDLALVQPILAAELLFVFGYLAIAGSRRVKRRDWLAAAAMSAGIGVFLRLAAPSGGRLHAPGSSWLLAALVTVCVVLAALGVAFGLGRRLGTSRGRSAAVLGSATGIAWGFMAAVIKELSSHLGGGPGAVFSTWSLYVLIAAGAATMLLASHALAAGPLAASQPGFTILDPLAASLLGMFLFGEHIRTGVPALAGEALTLAVVRRPRARRSPGRNLWRLSPSRPPSDLRMILTDRARSLVHWCDGQESKIRMRDSRVEMSGMSISNSGQKIRTGR